MSAFILPTSALMLRVFMRSWFGSDSRHGRQDTSNCKALQYENRQIGPESLVYAFNSAKFLRIRRPSDWLFSGWNCVAKTLPIAIIEQNSPP
jgi:hypothetical protein